MEKDIFSSPPEQSWNDSIESKIKFGSGLDKEKEKIEINVK